MDTTSTAERALGAKIVIKDPSIIVNSNAPPRPTTEETEIIIHLTKFRVSSSADEPLSKTYAVAA